MSTGTPGTLTADGVGAAGTLLGVQVTEAAQAVGELVPGREALARQRLLAGRAHEALPVPGLLPVGDASRGDGLQEAGGRGSGPSLSSLWGVPDPHLEHIRCWIKVTQQRLYSAVTLDTPSVYSQRSAEGSRLPGHDLSPSGCCGIGRRRCHKAAPLGRCAGVSAGERGGVGGRDSDMNAAPSPHQPCARGRVSCEELPVPPSGRTQTNTCNDTRKRHLQRAS